MLCTKRSNSFLDFFSIDHLLLYPRISKYSEYELKYNEPCAQNKTFLKTMSFFEKYNLF